MGFDDGDRDLSKYDGFRVRWDKDQRAYVFESKEERDRWQMHQYGHLRDGFRTSEELTDARPLLYYTAPAFESPEQEARYLRAVRSCPLSEYGHLKLDDYLREVATVAEGIAPRTPAVRAMQ